MCTVKRMLNECTDYIEKGVLAAFLLHNRDFAEPDGPFP